MAAKKDFTSKVQKITEPTPAEAKPDYSDLIPLVDVEPKQDTDSTAAQFISDSARKQSAATEAARAAAEELLKNPDRLRVVPATKSARMQLLVYPSTQSALKEIAARRGTSTNELVNQIFVEFIDKERGVK